MLANTVRSLSLLLAVVASPGVIGQDLSGLPPCALSCSESALNSINKACTQTDFACLCKNSDFIRATSACYKTSCTADQLSKAVEFGTKTCAQVGVNLASNAASTGVANAANATANAANATANAASNVAGAVARAANSTSSLNNGSPTSNPSNSNGNPAAASANTFGIVVLGTAVASLLLA